MRMKCIGGLSNGRIMDLESHLCEENNIVRVVALIDIPVIDFDPNKIPEIVSTPYHYYKVCTVHSGKYTIIKFLIPSNWEPEQALAFALGT